MSGSGTSRRIVVGIGGGIAAYKTCSVIRHFTEAGHDVDEVGSVATADIATHLGRKPQSLSPARDALLKKGLIYSGERGRIAFTVPHFGRYLLGQA